MNQELVKKLDEINESKKASRDDGNTELRMFDNKMNIDFYKQELRKRDQHIRDMDALYKADNIELQFYKDEVKKYKKNELNLNDQINKIRLDQEEIAKKMKNVENENRNLKTRAQQDEEKLRNNTMLKQKFEQEKTSDLAEMEKLRNELQIYSEKLCEKSNQVKVLKQKSNSLEKENQEKDEQLTKTNQELIMTVAHVEALRLENHFLRQSLVEKKSEEKEVVEMQEKYHQVLDLTEKENKRLKGEIVSLTDNVENLRMKLNSPNKLAERNKNTSNNTNNEFELRKTSRLREEYEKQMNTLKKQHELSVKRLNNEIEKLNSEKHAIQAEFENPNKCQGSNYYMNNEKSSTNKSKSNRSNNVSSIHGGDSISHGVLSITNPNSINQNQNNGEMMKKNNAANYNRLEEPCFIARSENEFHKNLPRFNVDFENIDNSPAKSSRLSLVSQFRHDEHNKKKDLENMLDDHIESLRRSSGNGMEHVKSNINNFNNFI